MCPPPSSLSRFFDRLRSNPIDWSKVGCVAVLTGGVIALATLTALQCYQPFRRGRRRRSSLSTPFEDEDTISSKVRSQFYKNDEFQFINLSQGRVRYFLRRPSSSLPATPSSSTRVVVLVHGFSIASDIWKQQSDYLVEHGFTVLSFDNYGRGWSDAPDIRLDEDVYVGQIAELLFALGITTPIDLFGVSMGGAIVASFAARYPHAVRRLCMVCPAGLPIATPAAMGDLMKLPLIGPYLFKSIIPHMQDRGAAAQWEVKGSDTYEAWGKFASQNMKDHSGFVRTLYRTVTDYPMTNQLHNFEILARQTEMKKLILWGEKVRTTATPHTTTTTHHPHSYRRVYAWKSWRIVVVCLFVFPPYRLGSYAKPLLSLFPPSRMV